MKKLGKVMAAYQLLLGLFVLPYIEELCHEEATKKCNYYVSGGMQKQPKKEKMMNNEEN